MNQFKEFVCAYCRASHRSRKKRSNFAEKLADFVGVFRANFTKKQLVKNSQFCGYFQGKFR